MTLDAATQRKLDRNQKCKVVRFLAAVCLMIGSLGADGHATIAHYLVYGGFVAIWLSIAVEYWPFRGDPRW